MSDCILFASIVHKVLFSSLFILGKGFSGLNA